MQLAMSFERCRVGQHYKASEVTVMGLDAAARRVCVGGGLDQRVGGGGGDAAVVVAVARHLDVAEVAPRAAPRVLHQPVVAAVLVRAVPHHQHLRDTHHALVHISCWLRDKKRQRSDSTS